jgi:alkylated DNA repair dioxygenase AlkB
MAHQLAFFAPTERLLAETPDARAFYVPALFSFDEAAPLFSTLRDAIAWNAGTMWMYDREVAVPRLTAHYNATAVWPEALVEMGARVGARLHAPFNAVGLNLYRDGRDSVAWHCDKDEDLIADPTVAVISLGATRAMHVRPKDPPRHAVRVEMEPGSALVMTGAAQDRFEHAVLKDNAVHEPRISVVFRTKN